MANARRDRDWDEVIARVSGPTLDKGRASELVKLVSAQLGERPIRVFPKGIPWPDGIVVHTVVDRDILGKVFDLLGDQARIDSLKVFPHGIPNPDVFLAEIEMR